MIDIHCHILYGIDDGAQDLHESIEMARVASKDGIRHLFATPHFNENHFNPEAQIKDKVIELQQHLDQQQIPITIYPSNEVRLESAAFIYKHAEHFAYLGPAQKFILLEQKWKDYSQDSLEIVQWFMQRGTIPIIPHPERHYFFRKQPELLIRLIDEGCWTQVSVDSLLGKNSDDAMDFAHRLIDSDLAHILATDAHNLHRKPNLSEGFRIVTERAGSHKAEEMLNRAMQILEK
jgi:protein-tyrosine phosphatase